MSQGNSFCCSNEVLKALQALARDIKGVRNILEGALEKNVEIPSETTNNLGHNVHGLMEACTTLDDEYESVKKAGDECKKAAIQLIQALTSDKLDPAKTAELLANLAQKVKEMHTCAITPVEKPVKKEESKVTPKKVDLLDPVGGKKVVDLEFVKDITSKEIPRVLQDLRDAYKDKDESKGDDLMKELYDMCKKLLEIGSSGSDLRKLIRSALKKIDSLRKTDGADVQLKTALKELYNLVKEVLQRYKSQSTTSGRTKALNRKTSFVIDAALKGIQENVERGKDPSDIFSLVKLLGKGASGSVYKAIYTKSGNVVAIKRVPLKTTNLTATNKEIQTMKAIKHENTLRYYGCYQKGTEVWIVMELCDCGSVQDLLMKGGRGLEEPYIAAITSQVLQGLDYLHTHCQLIHRDIKSANLLLNRHGQLKIADFGTAAEGDVARHTVIGSSYWMAPEAIDSSKGYDRKADIWSLGITIMEMAEKDPPFFNIQPQKAVLQIISGPPPSLKEPDKWSVNFQSFVKACLQKDPRQRPDATVLSQHVFITTADKTCLLKLLSTIAPPEEDPLPSGDDADYAVVKAVEDRKPSFGVSKSLSSGVTKREKPRRSIGVSDGSGKIKVYLNNPNDNVYLRIPVEPTIDAKGLNQKCDYFFKDKISSEEPSKYFVYFILDGVETVLDKDTFPFQITRDAKKYKKDLQFVYKKV